MTSQGTSRAHGTVGSAPRALWNVMGFAAGIALLAIVSLIAIPAMIAAGGPRAWAAVATGQAVGGVAAVIVAYGWGVTGPARIARSDRPAQLSEYLDSLGVRLALLVPLAACAALLAATVSVGHAPLAALAAVTTATVGLKANWFFVGLRRPYLLLVLEMVPRAAGTLVGIWAAGAGAGVAAVLWGQLGGMALAAVCAGAWILSGPRTSGWWRDRRRLRTVLDAQRHGVSSSALTGLYAALPIVIVGLIAPSAQPAFAVLDKIVKQVASAVSPVVTVLQGWVPAGPPERVFRRARAAVLVTTVAAMVLAAVVIMAGDRFVEWLGDGQIEVSGGAIALLAAVLAMALLGAVLMRAVLVALDRLSTMTQATLIGTVIGLIIVAAAVGPWGVEGALAGMLTGYGVKVTLGLAGARSPSAKTARAHQKTAGAHQMGVSQ